MEALTLELQESSYIESSSGTVSEYSRKNLLKLKSENLQSKDSKVITKLKDSSVNFICQ